jgi:hypothetical protein
MPSFYLPYCFLQHGERSRGMKKADLRHRLWSLVSESWLNSTEYWNRSRVFH